MKIKGKGRCVGVWNYAKFVTTKMIYRHTDKIERDDINVPFNIFRFWEPNITTFLKVYIYYHAHDSNLMH